MISEELLNRLPSEPPLDHAACFGVVDEGAENFDQVLGRFSGVPGADDRLQALGWQGSAFRQFSCQDPPDGETSWIDVSVHLFTDSTSAQDAVDYFTEVRLEGLPHIQGDSPGIGDHSTALSGPDPNGKDFTIYASQGSLLIRVTGVAPSGIPFIDVLKVARTMLAELREMPQASGSGPTEEVPRTAESYLPVYPLVRHGDCFKILDEGAYSYPDVVDALQAAGLTRAEVDELGWQDGAYRVFSCENPPDGRAAQIDVVIHQFQDAASALPHLSSHRLGANEMRSCDTEGSLVVCIFGRSLTGSPLSDVALVLQQVIEAAR